MDVFIGLCREHNVPVIVDMASEYDLRGPIALGASIAIYSGHKFLSGVTSGIVAGSEDLVRALYLQHRGIGRTMKAGKESMVGAMAALELWETRDHDAVRASRGSTCRSLARSTLIDLLVSIYHAMPTGPAIRSHA